MKLAISNIGWDVAMDEDIFQAMTARGFRALEICPTKYLPNPAQASADEVNQLKKRFAAHGLSIVAFQSLLFGHPELTVFDSTEARSAAKDYLHGLIDLAERLGATYLVFGSPKNRRVSDAMPPEAVHQIAVDFFGELGQYAAAHHAVLCLEPNAAAYGANFAVTADETAAMVADVSSPGFRLHLDAGVMAMNAENPSAVVAKYGHLLAYAHVSEPKLAPVGLDHEVHHRAFAAALRQADYQGHVSIEMLPPPDGLDGLVRALDFTSEIYG